VTKDDLHSTTIVADKKTPDKQKSLYFYRQIDYDDVAVLLKDTRL
jgi:hypothetical protein